MIRLHELWYGFRSVVNTYGLTFILGGGFFIPVALILQSKFFKLALPGKVRKTNQLIKSLRHKTKLIVNFESTMDKTKNLLTEISYQIAESAHEIAEIKKEIEENVN